ncbi:TIGR03619 family F420-dependent LLM class oxidoreductase [Nonomuraea sp. NPDC050536]|uniref:TIGR03619 family F420-dependent LLM class oxidoreductase n=1 Tax=Nonomuraea sp. NPDC050536 TaxID=3364366 RepID=UPI0037C8A0F3
MRMGLAVPQYGAFADPRLSAEVATAAEDLGFDSLWVGDRLLTPTAPRSPYPGGDGTIPPEHQVFLDPLTILTVAATVTRRARLSFSTLNAFWQPPVVLARSLTTLDIVSGGRLDVGLGLGWSVDEYEAVGVPWRGRGDRLEETLDVLERLWGEDELVQHKGEHWTIPESTVLPKPVQRPRPPLLLGGFGAATLERIGRRADGWLAGPAPLPVLTAMWRAVRRHAEDAGRDPDALRLVVRANPVITAEPADEAGVPGRGTVDQVAAYLAATVTELGAEPMLDPHFAARDAEHYLTLAHDLREQVRDRVGRG